VHRAVVGDSADRADGLPAFARTHASPSGLLHFDSDHVVSKHTCGSICRRVTHRGYLWHADVFDVV
jgi:hypothetical protein